MTARGFKRKYRRAIIGLPSGYGKSELCAGILLTVATMEPVHNGQYGMVASSKDQIRNVYEKICTNDQASTRRGASRWTSERTSSRTRRPTRKS